MTDRDELVKINSLESAATHPRIHDRRLQLERAMFRRRRITVVIVVFLLLAVAIGSLVVFGPFFDVDRVEVEGNQRLSDADIIDLASVQVGDPLTLVDLAGAAAPIAEHPMVREVQVSRELPSTLRIRVEERVPVAFLSSRGEGWAEVDAEGRIIAIVPDEPVGLVEIEARTVDAPEGARVGTDLLAAVDLAATLPEGLAPVVQRIVVGSGGMVELRLASRPLIPVLLGASPDSEEVWTALATLIERVDVRCSARIDLRAPSVPGLLRLDGCETID